MTADRTEASTLAETAVAALVREGSAMGPAHAVLRLMMEATSPRTEMEFFRFLVEKIATTLGVHEVTVTECIDQPATTVRMLAAWRGGELSPNLEFELTGTPCEAVVHEKKVCFFPRNVGELFPAKTESGLQSYIGVPIFDADGSKVIGHIAIFDRKDMTDGILRDQFLVDTVLRVFSERAGAEIQRLHLTRSLRRSAESYRLILDNQNEFVVRVDESGHLLFVSPSYCRALGKRSDELLGTLFSMPLSQGVTDPDGECIAAPATGLPVIRSEEYLQTVSGWRWISWVCSPIADTRQDSGKDSVVVGRDVTDRKRAEELASEKLRELAHVARRHSLSEMSSAMAHEINQPLASIMTYAQACLRLSGAHTEDRPATAKALHSIVSAAEQAAQTIRRLRDFVRDGQPKRSELLVNRLVRDVAQLMLPQARRHGIRIHLGLDAAVGSAMLDSVQVQQVIVNLVQNAIDSVRSASAADRAVFIGTAIDDPTHFVITVTDHGGGVRAGIAQRLFDPFTTTKSDGLGIGLSISRSIVDAHGGTLSFAAVDPAGAQFQVRLPGGAVRSD